MYDVIISPEFKKEFERLEMPIQKRVRKILKKLETRHCGERLVGDLKGFYSVHFNRNHYRLIYAKENGIIKILCVHVGKRTNSFYKDFKELIKRKNQIS